jgi:hypothetical protein
MAFNANFLDARLKDDGTVVVSGQSTPPTVEDIVVTMAHGARLWTHRSPDADIDLWHVEFGPDGAFQLADRVHLTGVALRTDATEPLVWQAIFELVAETDGP